MAALHSKNEGVTPGRTSASEEAKSAKHSGTSTMSREETKPSLANQKRRNLQGFLDEVPDRTYFALLRIQELSKDGVIENRKATAAIQETLDLEGYPPQAVRRLTGILSHRGYLERVVKSGMLRGYRITDLGKKIITREIRPIIKKTATTGRKRILRPSKITEDDFKTLLERAKEFEEANKKLRQNEKDLAVLKKKREKLTARRDLFTAKINELTSQQASILEESQQLRKLVSRSVMAAEKLREIRDIIRQSQPAPKENASE